MFEEVLDMAYAVIDGNVFDIHHVNSKAKVVVVGISPGSSQSFNENYDKAKKDARYNNQQCAFRDPKRKSIQNNLIKMLDSIRINKYLDIESCSSLWSDEHFDKVNFISVLPHSVLKTTKEERIIHDDNDIDRSVEKFISKINYEEIQKSKLLKDNYDLFTEALQTYNKDTTIFIACGPSVYNILLEHSDINKKRIIPITHPSGANSGRVNVYCAKAIKPEKINDTSYQNALKYREIADELLSVYIK